MDVDDLSRDPQTKIFQITQVIWQGPFASHKRHATLRAAGITHILNVGETPSVLSQDEHGYCDVIWQPIQDLEIVPPDVVIRCLDTLHSWTSQPQSGIYVHCLAGWNRSPTIVWLYLAACGVRPETAKQIIERANLDAIAGHKKLIAPAIIELVQAHGRSNYLPLTRPEVINPAANSRG